MCTFGCNRWHLLFCSKHATFGFHFNSVSHFKWSKISAVDVVVLEREPDGVKVFYFL